MLKIANVIEEGRLGGPQLRMVIVAAHLQDQINTTLVFPRENSEPFLKLSRSKNINAKRVSLTRITKDWKVLLKYIIFFIPEIVRLASYFKKEKFDLVHVSGGSWQYKGIIAGKLAGIKTLWHVNDTALPLFLKLIFAVLNKLSNGIIYASIRSRKYYSPFVSDSIFSTVIPAPVDTSIFDPLSASLLEERLTQEWNNKLVIGMTGNISPVKGVDYFVEMAGKLCKEYPNIIFVILGPVFNRQQNYYDQLKERCEVLGLNQLFFVGGREDIRPILKRMDIYCCTSRAESSPLSVWEAMAMEKAIVANDVGDIAEYITNGVNGFIVSPGDINAFKNQVKVLIDQPEQRLLFGQRSRKIAVEKLDIQYCAEKHLLAYERIANDQLS